MLAPVRGPLCPFWAPSKHTGGGSLTLYSDPPGRTVTLGLPGPGVLAEAGDLGLISLPAWVVPGQVPTPRSQGVRGQPCSLLRSGTELSPWARSGPRLGRWPAPPSRFLLPARDACGPGHPGAALFALARVLVLHEQSPMGSEVSDAAAATGGQRAWPQRAAETPGGRGGCLWADGRAHLLHLEPLGAPGSPSLWAARVGRQ